MAPGPPRLPLLLALGCGTRAYLVSEMEALGLLPAGREGWLQPFAEGVNAVGLLPGADPTLRDEYVLVTAHYDHLGRDGEPGSQCVADGADEICNGAVDNATGCAATLAIARALLSQPEPPRRSVLFIFFDAEEDGLLGSRHFVSEDPLVPKAAIAAVLNLDTIGAEILPGVRSTFALGVEYSTGLRERMGVPDPVFLMPPFP